MTTELESSSSSLKKSPYLTRTDLGCHAYTTGRVPVLGIHSTRRTDELTVARARIYEAPGSSYHFGVD